MGLRGLSKGTEPVTWPDQYGPAERDEAYTSFSLSGWGGGCGHDAPMIALDALLGAGSDWEELMSRAGFHGGHLTISILYFSPVCVKTRAGINYALKGSSDAKFTFLSCLNINVCWKCVYTSIL